MKRNAFITLFFASFAIAALTVSCKKDNNLPYKGDQPSLPSQAMNYAHPDLVPTFTDVPVNAAFNVTDDGATLGRVLFYDKKLSLNNKISCGSCHHQANAFSDPVVGSTGFEGKLTPRNSIAITNPVLENNFFWDLRESNLEEMVTKPIKNHIEMGMEDLDDLAGKLAAVKYYPELFNKAFGSTEINRDRIADALTQFLRSMITCHSKWDMVQNNSSQNILTAQETEGMNIFFGEGRCYTCHNGRNLNEGIGGVVDPTTGGWSTLKAANIGLNLEYNDNGMGASDPAMAGVFKVPSLRNVALTPPYMHDGRFATLEDVVNHYNSNIEAHPNLDQRLRDWEGNPWRMNLNESKKASLVAFLKTFSDNQFTTDARYADPFVQ